MNGLCHTGLENHMYKSFNLYILELIEELETNYYKGAFWKLLPHTLAFDLYIKHSVHYNWVFYTFIYAFIHLTILSADFEPGTVLDTRNKASTISLPYGVDSQVGERYNQLNKWINKLQSVLWRKQGGKREKRRQLHKRMEKQKDIFLFRFLREL